MKLNYGNKDENRSENPNQNTTRASLQPAVN